MTTNPETIFVPLDRLEPHPANANVMPEHLLAKLTSHIRATGLYPPLIVRRMHGDDRSPRYQILDGHHRAIALRRLGKDPARCEVWDANDEQAAMLLLTLNRLRGEDDPHRRGELLTALSLTFEMDELESMLPDNRERIERLMALTQPPPSAPPLETELPAVPRALTFFLDEAAYRATVKALGAIDSNRAAALLKALGIDRKRNEACPS